MTPGSTDAAAGARLLRDLWTAARAGDEPAVRALLGRAGRHRGALVQGDAGGPLRPSPAVVAELRRAPPDADAPWLLPCVVKPAPADPRAAAELRAIARALTDRRPESHVETHLVAGVEVALYVDAAVDLRSLLADGAGTGGEGELVRAVHERCLERLLDYAEHVDPHARAARRDASGAAAEPAAFGYARRLRDATAALERALDAPAEPDAEATSWDELAGLCECRGGRRALFYDPKPANFLAPESSLRAGRPADPVYKVDVDWMLTDAPVAHQALVAVLSHPIRAARADEPAAVLDELLALVDSVLPAGDASPAELDALAVYHLYRNYSSKLREPAGRALKPFLVAAIERLDAAPIPGGTARLVEACDRLPVAA